MEITKFDLKLCENGINDNFHVEETIHEKSSKSMSSASTWGHLISRSDDDDDGDDDNNDYDDFQA